MDKRHAARLLASAILEGTPIDWRVRRIDAERRATNPWSDSCRSWLRSRRFIAQPPSPSARPGDASAAERSLHAVVGTPAAAGIGRPRELRRSVSCLGHAPRPRGGAEAAPDRPPRSHDPSASLSDPARVVNEGRLLARVRHPHVITVYGAEPRDGTVGIWMEFIRGRTLQQIVEQQGPLGAREAAGVGTDLCRAWRRCTGRSAASRRDRPQRHARGRRSRRPDGLRRRPRAARRDRRCAGQGHHRHAALHGAGAVRRARADRTDRHLCPGRADVLPGDGPLPGRRADRSPSSATRTHGRRARGCAISEPICRRHSCAPSRRPWLRIRPTAFKPLVRSKRRSNARSPTVVRRHPSSARRWCWCVGRGCRRNRGSGRLGTQARYAMTHRVPTATRLRSLPS